MIVIYFLLNFLTFWTIFRKQNQNFDNWWLKISFTLFISTYISTIIIFIFACLLSLFTDHSLIKATYTYFFISILFLIWQRKIVWNEVIELTKKLSHLPFKVIIYMFIIFGISYIFFAQQLDFHNNKIYISYTYWDFKWHINIIQNFVQGDNFPPFNEAVAGILSIYHFFPDLVISIFNVLGLNIAWSINSFSSIFLSFIIFSGIGIARSIINSKWHYVLIPLFVWTHGSLKFLTYMVDLLTKHITLAQIFLTKYPYDIDFNKDGFFGYNGNMINLFYFIEERQLIFACFALLIFIYILLNLKKFDRRFLIFLAIAFGLFVQWHLYVSIMFVIISMAFTGLNILPRKKEGIHKYVLFTLILLITYGIYAACIKLYINLNPYFDHQFINSYPQINFDFSTMLPVYKFSVWHLILYYLFAYGGRLLFYGTLFWYTFKKKSPTFLILLSLLPVFILINSVQFSPLSIYDNHKWLRPFDLAMDTFLAIYFIPIMKELRFSKISMIGYILLLSISGVISFFTYLFQIPDTLYANLNRNIYKKILNTPPHSIYLTDDYHTVLLAGRKTYIGPYNGENYLGNEQIKREKILHDSIQLKTPKEICNFAKKRNIKPSIDYVYFEKKKIFINMKTDCK